jgi:hypothetical protein
MTAYQLLVTAHIAAGSIALITFWVAAFARKGSPIHKATGKGYLLSMLGILATALPMALVFISRGRIGIGVFFAYLVVITGTSVWLAWRSIRMKRDVRGYHDRRYQIVGWANVLAGLAVFAIGLDRGSALLMGFCWVGVFIGIGMIRQVRNLPTAPNWWLREHYGAMLGNGVATHVAFLGVGMRSVLASFDQAWLQLLPWFAPLAVALIAGVYLNRRYGSRKAMGAGAQVTA